MRFILMHRQNEQTEAGIPPSPELLTAMGKFIGEGFQAGTVRSGEGLQRSARRARVRRSAGRLSVEQGPYKGANELVAGIAMIKVKSKEEAIEWAKRLNQVLGDVEIEAGQLNEPWDLGVAPKPHDAPLRFLLLRKADRNTESGRPAGAATLIDEMKAAGVFLMAEDLQPSSVGVRLSGPPGRQAVLDGPFAEAKELIGGFAIVHLPSMEQAVEFGRRFANVFGGVGIVEPLHIEVRPLVS